MTMTITSDVIAGRLIAEADDAQVSYWNQIRATEAALLAVDEAQTALQAAERALDEVEAEVLLEVMLKEDGPINGKNETIRRHQQTEYLKDEPKYLTYRDQVEAARLTLRDAKRCYETTVHQLTALRHFVELKTAQMQMLAATHERS